MTLSHVIVANTSPSFTVNEDATYNDSIAYTGAQNFVITDPPYESTDVNKVPHYLSFHLNSDGSFTFQGIADYNGTLKFDWTATNSTLFTQITGQATINVASVNDAPQLVILNHPFKMTHTYTTKNF